MSGISRRQMIQRGLAGLAATGVASLTLRSDAAPTDATADLHNYEKFLDKNGIPQVQPAARWEASTKDILGPFYMPGAPFRGKVTSPLAEGDPLVIRGRIWGFDTKKPLANSVLDIWQADAHGSYDMDDPRNPPQWNEFKNRIRLITDETGYYEYETIRPAAYQIGPGRFRPAHIHYMIQSPGYTKLITQLYFAGDKHIQADPWASKSNLVIETEKVPVGGASYKLGTFDIVLAKS